jgi:hypothetical protein
VTQYTRVDIVLAEKGEKTRAASFWLPIGAPAPQAGDTLITHRLQLTEILDDTWPIKVRVTHRQFDLGSFDEKNDAFRSVIIRLHVEAVES